MSNPYGPTIETIDDWNAILAHGCCCLMPVAPAPSMKCESLNVSASTADLYFDEDGIPHSKRVKISRPPVPASGSETGDKYHVPGRNFNFPTTGPTYSAGGFTYTDSRKETEELIPPIKITKCGASPANRYSMNLSGSASSSVETIDGFWKASGGPGGSYETRTVYISASTTTAAAGAWVTSGTSTISTPIDASPYWSFDTETTSYGPNAGGGLNNPYYEHEKPVALDDVRKAMKAATSAASFTECPAFLGTSCSSSYSEQVTIIEDFGSFIHSASAVKVRYRWRVPTSHLGTYFKITWDVLYQPIGWDDTDIPLEDRPIRYSRKNLTVEWTGPGTGDQSDPSWLAGDWQELEVPDEPGVRRVINIRYSIFQDDPFAP